MDVKVKDFATMQGVSESIVYRHIRQHKEALGDRVIKRGNATWLTDEGQEYIRGLMMQQPIVVGDSSMVDELDRLRKENDRLKDKLIAVQEMMATAQGELMEHAEMKARLKAAETTSQTLRELSDYHAERATEEAQKAAASREKEAQAVKTAEEAAQRAAEAAREAQELREALEVAEASRKAAEAREAAQKAKYDALAHRSFIDRLFNRGVEQ